MEEQLQSPVRYGSGANQQQQQKQLFKDHSHDGSGHDSGYTSYQSFNASCSVVRSSVLATIEEDNEADSSFEEPRKVAAGTSSSILTPTTTASMELISNFHLTTPNSGSKENMLVRRRTLARKPTCQNLFAMRTPEKSAEGSPARSGRKSAEMGILTPRKNKSSGKRKHGSFREKLYSDGDAGSLENDCKKLEDISPIPHNKRRRNSAIDDFIRSSTPKTASFKSNFHVETQENLKPTNKKTLVLRKFQSFSPSKMHSYRKRDTVLQEKSLLTNRKAPLQRQNAIQTTPQKRSPEASLELSFNATPDLPNPPQKPSTFAALLDGPILAQTSSSVEESLKPDLTHEVSLLPSFIEDDSVLRDAPAPRRISVPSILNDQLESPTLFSPTLPRTPKSSRKLKRLSSTSATKKDRPKPVTSPKPAHRTTIPGTYRTRRNYDGVERLNILKRLNEHDKDALEIVLSYLADSDLVRIVSVSRSWRTIIESNRRFARRLRDYLAKEAHSKENFDRSESIVGGKDESKLLTIGDGGKVPAVAPRQPFSLCNSIDGNHSVMSNVSLAAPKSPPVSPSRRKFHENQKIASHLKKSERLKPCPRCGKPSRVVAQNKIRSTLGSTSKSASAASAKLEKSYTLPETTAPSHVISPPPSPPSNSPDGSTERIRRNLFSTSSMLFPSRACSVDGAGATPVVVRTGAGRRSSSDATLEKKRGNQQRRRQSSASSSSSEESQCDYAVCSGKGCGFTFCVKCLCEHHPDAVCKDLAPNSPSKEDAPVQYVACSKQSRRSLLRLCK